MLDLKNRDVFSVEVTQDVLDYLALIEEQTKRAIEKKLSRFSLEWGLWSAKMNRELRGQSGILYRYLFVYWVVCSQVLELKLRRFFGQAKLKRLQKDRQYVREIITTGNAPAIDDGDIKSLLASSLFAKKK